MKRIFASLGIFLVFTSYLFAQPETGRNILIEPASGNEQRRALLVGVNQYEALKEAS